MLVNESNVRREAPLLAATDRDPPASFDGSDVPHAT